MKPKRKPRSPSGTAADELICPLCDSESIETFLHSHAFKYGSGDSAVTLRVDKLPVRRCTACDLEFTDHEGERLQHDAVCRHLGVLTPTEVREIRKRYGMTTAAFAETSGLGPATLSRWETGALVQNRANDLYLRLVRIPSVMRILQHISADGPESARKADVSGRAFHGLDLNERVLREHATLRFRPEGFKLAEAIARAKCLSNWLHEQVNGRRFEGRRQQRWGSALLQQSWEISDAVVHLLERNLPGPGWSLARPLCESFVRGIWILHCASDEDMERFRHGEPPGFPKLLEAISSHREASLHVAWLRATSANRDVFHDFTHGGIEHVLRRVSEDMVEPRYPERELEYLLGLSVEVYLRVGCELLSLMGDVGAKRQLFEKVESDWKRLPLV